MKKWFFLLLSLPFVFGACKKDKDSGCTATESTQVATSTEIDSLQRYLNDHNITASQHESGVFYHMDSTGTGLKAPGVCSSIAVRYRGYLLGNTVPFDQYIDSGGVVMTLENTVAAWQRTLPLMRAGGGMTIYLPPSMGYGSVDKKNPDGDIIVPKNSYTKFSIELLDVY